MKEERITNVNLVVNALAKIQFLTNTGELFMKEEKIKNVKSVENFLDNVLILEHIIGDVTN